MKQQISQNQIRNPCGCMISEEEKRCSKRSSVFTVCEPSENREPNDVANDTNAEEKRTETLVGLHSRSRHFSSFIIFFPRRKRKLPVAEEVVR